MILQNKCPICKSDSIKILFQDNVIGNGHYPFQKITKNFFTPVVHNNPVIKKILNRSYILDIRECIECNHLFQRNIFNPEEELEFHQSYFKIDGINDGFSTNNINIDKLLISEINFLKSFFNFTNILDVGASSGEFCDLIKQYNIQPSSLDLCLKTNFLLEKKNIEVFSSTTEINKSFNVIRVCHVLSHIHNNIEKFIKDLILILDHGGIIYFIDHLNNNNKNIRPVFNPLLHVNLFSEKSFNVLINNFSDLKLIKHYCTIYSESNFFKIYRRM